MDMEMLREFKVLSFRSRNGECVFGRPKALVDEGAFYRIGDLHVLNKNGVHSMDQRGDLLTIQYQDGSCVELRIQ